MKEHSFLDNFEEEDLIAFNHREKILRIQNVKNACSNTLHTSTDYKRHQVGKTAQVFHGELSERVASGQWLGEGIECEVLRLGEKQWTKGCLTVRVIVEFNPDEQVNKLSELDTFRENNS
jgi:hypothetical protein